MIATHVGAGVEPLRADRYVCSRCGGVRECKTSRTKPAMCSDCRWVEAYQEPDRPVNLASRLTDDECRAARRAAYAGDTSEATKVAVREYWRRVDQRKRDRRSA